MPFRFRRSIRIVPGLRLNVGRRGLSASATLPHTGISYTVTTPHGGAGRRRSPQPGSWVKWLGSTAIVLAGLWWFGWL